MDEEPPKAVHAVYIVDPDESVRDSVSRLLALYELTVFGFDSAESLFAHMDSDDRRECSAFLFAECDLPGMKGAEMAERTRKRCMDLPVVLMTTNPPTASVVAAVRAGVLDVLEKPFIELQVVEHLRAVGLVTDPPSCDDDRLAGCDET